MSYTYCSARLHKATGWLLLLAPLTATVTCMHAVKCCDASMCTRPLQSPLRHQHVGESGFITTEVALPASKQQQCEGIKALDRNLICNRSTLYSLSFIFDVSKSLSPLKLSDTVSLIAMHSYVEKQVSFVD